MELPIAIIDVRVMITKLSGFNFFLFKRDQLRDGINSSLALSKDYKYYFTFTLSFFFVSPFLYPPSHGMENKFIQYSVIVAMFLADSTYKSLQALIRLGHIDAACG